MKITTLARSAQKDRSEALLMKQYVLPHHARKTLSSETKSDFQEINAMDVEIANLDQLLVNNKADAANNIVTQTRLLKAFVP
jgi:hypothetical protein